MVAERILEVLERAKKGRYYKLTKSKDLGNGIVKISDMLIRLGIDYSHMSINENKQTGSLPWGTWKEGFENLVIQHKGKHYLRITSRTPEHPDSGADVISTRYYKNGVEISYDEVVAEIGEKKVSTKASSVYNIDFDNIIKIWD